MRYIIDTLSWVMNGCYDLCGNYGMAIILFTFLSKIILLPVSIWVQKNSIKMVKMQPEINFIKVNFFGDKDAIAEEQSKVFKREKYSPMVSIIPLVIQIALLMGVIEVVKAGMENPEIDMNFLHINLSLIPSNVGISLLWVSIVAGVSAWLLCIAQNASNVLQSEQSKANKYGTMIFSVGLSIYLGWFVSIGVVLYWVASNIMAIIQLYLLNIAINPKKYVDYERLNESKKELEALENLNVKRRKIFRDASRRREKTDYKRFFKITNKHLVFYSEGSGFYKYYRGIIEYLLEKTNIIIHYITSDPDDAIFKLSEKQSAIKPYYIGEKKLITLMMKMDADVVVMTMPDLQNFHIKRSYVRKDIDYIYIPHYMDSMNLTMRQGCLNNYDTVFCVGKDQKNEILKTEEIYHLKSKKLIEWGYCLLDDMTREYENTQKIRDRNEKPQILIAPSWQPDNIVDSCLEQILDGLKGHGYHVIVRPHPQHVRHRGAFIEQLKSQYEADEDIEIQTDFSSNSTVFESDIVITDWSSIAYDYAYSTKKPVLFINTPMKIMNPDYKKIGIIPINIKLREEIGASLDTNRLDEINDKVRLLLNEKEKYIEKINNFVNECVYNLGESAEVGAKYIISSIQNQINKRKGEETK